MKGFPRHFERQDGSPFWFLGDTAWALFTDKAEEKHDRAAALRVYRCPRRPGLQRAALDAAQRGRLGQSGRPAVGRHRRREAQPRLLAGSGSSAGACQRARASCAAWRWPGATSESKSRSPGGCFPSVEARKRYARYIAARYSAYDVYFIVSGEWHGEVRTRPSTDEAVRQEFIEIGDALPPPIRTTG